MTEELSQVENYIIERSLSPQSHEKDHEGTFSNPIRPKTFDEFPGQEHIKKNLSIYVQAAKNRGEVLDHVLLHGPPGLGKTTLAQIIAHELEVPFQHTIGPALTKPGDLAGAW